LVIGRSAETGLRRRKRKSHLPDSTLSGGSLMDELHDKHVEIDERWLSEWFEFGFAELSSYLAKHAAFDDYCHKNEID
jgi:hypothetical protein